VELRLARLAALKTAHPDIRENADFRESAFKAAEEDRNK